jgi:hypothetical protein
MKTWLYLLLVAIALILLPSCAPGQNTSVKNEGITLTEFMSDVGPNPQTRDEQIYSYQFKFHNSGANSILIQSFEPMITEAFARKARTDNLKVTLNRQLTPDAYTLVTGEIPFDGTGVTGDQLAAMDPFVTGIKLDSGIILPIKW